MAPQRLKDREGIVHRPSSRNLGMTICGLPSEDMSAAPSYRPATCADCSKEER